MRTAVGLEYPPIVDMGRVRPAALLDRRLNGGGNTGGDRARVGEAAVVGSGALVFTACVGGPLFAQL